MKRKAKKKEVLKPSMFDYHVQAAVVAARLGISLSYAFDRYIKPTMPDGPIDSLRSDQYAMVWGNNG